METQILEDLKHIIKYTSVLGIDEAGRGPWAGPVAIAGVLLTNDTPLIPGINDSKKLTAKKRAELYQQIIETHPYKLVLIDNTVIDKIGIGNAVIEGMREIIEHFNAPLTLIDGYFKQGSFTGNTQCIIKGDSLCYSIGAASIIAKHTRDMVMDELDLKYPEYNFKSHKGYGTKEHMELLQKYGVSNIHRKSYKPIKNMLVI